MVIHEQTKSTHALKSALNIHALKPFLNLSNMTKEILIQIIRDSLVSGNINEAYEAIDVYVNEINT